ncbi:MAG: hypothetical protein JET69_04890 [Methanomassiliicoccales archaeon]|nr:hypothetical protein [Methanomassiliicoccales archaeon]
MAVDTGNQGVKKADNQVTWQIWVSGPLNKDADVLVKWSRTSFFGGCPTAVPMLFDDIEYSLFQKCSEEWTVRYALSTAVANYRFIKLLKNWDEVALDPYIKDLPRPTGKILGDAATMGRSGGMC